jgi:hypothetical protein
MQGIDVLQASTIALAINLPRPTRKLCKGFFRAQQHLKCMDFEFTNLSLKVTINSTPSFSTITAASVESAITSFGLAWGG